MQKMLPRITEHGPKSTQNPVKMDPGTPWGSIVKLRSELYGFQVLFGVPLWPYFLTFFDVIFFSIFHNPFLTQFWKNYDAILGQFWKLF